MTPRPVAYAPRRLGHVNFFVNDFTETIDFLKTVCGFGESGRESTVRSGFLSNGNTHHDVGFIDLPGWQKHATSRVVEGPPGRGRKPSLNHYGFEMRNEVDLVDAYKRALDAGMKPRITHNGTSKSNYIFDPYGNQYQLYADETLDWRSVYTGGESEFHANPPWNPLEGAPDPTAYWDPNPVIARHEEAPLHPMRVTHGVMASHDVPGFTTWLTEVLGLRLVGGDAKRVSYLAGKESRYDIVVIEAPGGTEPGLHHASFQVWPNDDLDQAAAELAAIGIKPYARIDTGYKRSLFLHDPSGLLLEFYTWISMPTPDLSTDDWRLRV